ncbi:MAG: NapH/MauN family ferredoxin-type protein [Campylobacteraceae bacterium]|jgi:ferredoxin-type protein NapH|nr:NapH/MauN family ferredoxin-type protein [Campylobacteraceae bacterium]
MNKYKAYASIDKTRFFDTFITTNKNGKKRLGIRFYRWFSIFCINFLFFLSYRIDLQALEGTLSGSRFFGFHLIDPFISMQMFLAHHNLHVNLIIGTVTILAFYLIMGGRAFCSWVCPYNILGEISERLHKILVEKKIIRSYKFNHKIKYVFWVFFLFLAFFAGYLVFEIINPVGILSRAIVYGWSFALLIVTVLFLVEVFFAQRFWCRYICPIGTTYSFLGWISVMKIKRTNECDRCNACSKVCLVPHVLKKQDKKEITIISGECTLCGRCIEVCHKDALIFDTKLKKLI